MTPRLGDRIRLLRDGSVWVLTVYGWAPVASTHPEGFEEPDPNMFVNESADGDSPQDELAVELFIQARAAYSMGHVQAIDPIVYQAQARTLLAAGWVRKANK